MKAKIMFIVLLVGIILINGCIQHEGKPSQELPAKELPPQEESKMGKPSQELSPQELPAKELPPQEESKMGRPEQAEMLLEELNALYTFERDMLRKMYEGYNDELMDSCEDELDKMQVYAEKMKFIDLCSEKTGELIDYTEEEELKIFELKQRISDEILEKGQFTDEDLVNLYEELSNELSKSAEEGRSRLKEFNEKLSPIAQTPISPTTTYYVTKVIDGDTIEINTGEIVRLIGINAPEEGEKCYKESKEYLEAFLSDKEVTLERDMEDKDQYGRLLRYVFADRHNVNYGMVYLGFAHKYEYGSNTKYSSQFEQAEDEAKQNEGCLWEISQENYIIDQCFHITNFHFNAAGDDNYNLNDEYVTFRNKCSYLIDMSGWTIKDETASHIYTIPAFTFQGGSTFTLFTGTGTNTNSALYWGRTSGDYAAIWNNGGDTLFLRDSDGNLVLSQSYSGY